MGRQNPAEIKRSDKKSRPTIQHTESQSQDMEQTTETFSNLALKEGSLQSQVALLQKLPTPQQQTTLRRIGRVQGNQHAQRVVTSMPSSASGKGKSGSAAISLKPSAPTHSHTVQAKMAVSNPGDQQEVEADQVAEQVMKMPAPATPSAPNDSGDEKPSIDSPAILNRYVQRAKIQRADGIGGNEVNSDVQSRIEGMQSSGGKPLPESEREFFEPRMGVDLGGVRVHSDSTAVQTSKDLNARAYAVGQNIAFNSGEYQPGTTSGRRLMAHELTHVVQQGGASQLQPQRQAELNRVQRTQNLVQRTPSDYKSNADIKLMTLTAFDRYAHAQADWATSSALGTDKEKLRSLLAFARNDDGLVLGACGKFKVQDLYAIAAGQGTVDIELIAYSRAASPDKNAGTVHIEVPAADAAEAVKWGTAIDKLKAGIGGPIIDRVISQNATYQGLKKLVDAGAVDDFVTYFTDVGPLLCAETGMEVYSYLEFRKEGGQTKYANYQSDLPEILNYHRFTVPQLDALITNKANAVGNKSLTTPLPISVILQTALDHNGAFHRDPNMTSVIDRTTHITLVAEGKDSLAAYSSELETFASYGKDGKVDEVMLSGHGDAKIMELPTNEYVSVDKDYSDSDELNKTNDFILKIKSLLRDDPNSRIVLNACLTASNSVDVTLDSDPVKAAKQITDAIAADPSLATAIKAKFGTHKGNILGANGSFGRVSLLDSGGNLDIISGDDPKLTASKLEYVEFGTEPTGTLRAVLESWAQDQTATIEAIKRRLITNASEVSWSEKLISSLLKIIVAEPDNAALIKTLIRSAGALGHLPSRPECTVNKLKNKVLDAHMDAIFTSLMGSDLWIVPDYNFVPAVVFQVWMEKNTSKVGEFLTFLNSSTFNTLDAASILDLDHLKPFLSQLLLSPSASPPRGEFLIALLYLVQKKDGAPNLCKNYIQDVVGSGNQEFPSSSNVADILQGASQQNVLEDAGVVNASTTTTAEPNVAPTGSGDNTLAVESVTMKCTIKTGTDAKAYKLPKGKKIGNIPADTELNIIGKIKAAKLGSLTDVNCFAVEHTIRANKTVFIAETDVNVI